MVSTPLRADVQTPGFAVIGGWIALFFLVFLAYWPGLKGPFVLDDFDAISALGKFGGVHDWESFKAFVFGGQSGPTGRPVALLSFLIDGNNWPADPWPFKRTNLAVHLLNGALLGTLIGKILDVLEFDNRDARWIALISAAAWLLHPFLVSTTLYTVQRMAQLATLFVFAGLVVHIWGRSFLPGNPKKAYLIMSASVTVFTLLAIFSKENGVLLPMLIGVIEITVFASQKTRLPVLDRYWLTIFIIIPSLLIGIVLGSKFFAADFFEVSPPRDFSVYERFITQPRILIDYLRHWFIPELYTSGVYQDHFTKSHGIFSPVTTALGALLIVAIVAIGFVQRRRRPLFALAILFFFGSHLLESTVVNLELYFEHRNYLAAAFLFLPLVVLLRQKAGRTLFFVVAAGVLLVLGGFTRYSATVWQTFPSIVEASARKAPTSARAQAQYANLLFNEQQPDAALRVIDRAIQTTSSEHPLLLVNRLIILCNTDALTAGELNRVATSLSRTIYDPRSIKLYLALTDAVAERRCPEVSLAALHSMYTDMLQVPENARRQALAYSHLKYFIGAIDIYLGAPASAVANFKQSLQAEPGAEQAMTMAARLATAGYFEQALYFSDLALSSLTINPKGYLQPIKVRESDIRAFQATVKADIAAQSGAGSEKSQTN